MNKIELEQIDKVYDKKVQVLKNLNLEIEEGSFSILLGPSGCGKSTILRMIAGLEEVTKGNLKIDGENMNEVSPGDRDIAMVFQNYAIYPTMTVQENIEFGLKNLKIPKAERKRRIQETGEITGLGQLMERKPNALSGGQRQRVALARAMVKNPQVFLMDEPLSNLDAKLRSQLRLELIELHQKLGTTFVYVTHDQVEAMSMGTQIILMNQGEIMQIGSPEEIYTNPENVFTARFIGNPPMNIFETTKGKLELSSPKSAFYAGFRPEHVHFFSQEDCIEMSGAIMAREMLGAEVLYKIKTDIGDVLSKNFTIHDRYEGIVNLYIEKRNLYFFDEQENRIRDTVQRIEGR